MKKFISLILAAILAASVLASCATDTLLTPNSSLLTSTSSGTPTNADLAWLGSRLGEVPDGLTAGLASDLGIDMTAFEDDGYMIRTDKSETVVAAKTADGLDRALRKYAKAYEKGEVSDVTYHEGYRVKKITIAGADISEFTVVRPAETNENMLFAISELVRLVEKACGVRLPVADSASGHKITFAFSDDPALKFDGYTYEVKNGDLNFTGARARGSMYAVWRFLENELGWDNLIHGDCHLNESDLVEIPEGLTKSETPAFQYVNLWTNTWKNYHNDRATPNDAQNSYGAMEEAHHGMHWNMFCEEDFASRQICYTDEVRYEECYENVYNYVNVRLSAGQKIGYEFKAVDIAQGDTSNYCNCKECQKVYKEEGGNSGAVVRFANRLSEEINEVFRSEKPDSFLPGNDINFLIFAYAGTNTAPLITAPNEYVWVTFCYDVNCSNHRVDGSECTTGVKIADRQSRDNALYASWIESWSAVTQNIYVWFYELDTGLQQYFIFDNLYYDFKYFNDIGVQGIFFQCLNHGFGIQYIAHMIVSEMNWNMDMTENEYEAMLCRILEREFGEGWENIRRYIDIRNTAQDLVDCWHCWWLDGRASIDHIYDEDYTLKRYNECIELIGEAQYLADSAEQELEAKTFSLHCMYEGCFCGYAAALDAGDEEQIAFWNGTYQTLLERMVECGFDPFDKGIYSIDGARLKYERTLAAEAHHWKKAGNRGKWYEKVTIPEE